MANKIIHKHSSVITDKKAKLPSSTQLEYGEIAINYAEGVETISFKNTNDKIVEIKTNEYYEKIITDNELVTAQSLTDLDKRVNLVKEGLSDYVKSEELEGYATKEYLNTEINKKQDTLSSYTETNSSVTITSNDLILPDISKIKVGNKTLSSLLTTYQFYSETSSSASISQGDNINGNKILMSGTAAGLYHYKDSSLSRVLVSQVGEVDIYGRNADNSSVSQVKLKPTDITITTNSLVLPESDNITVGSQTLTSLLNTIDTVAYPQINQNTNNTTFTLLPNKFYVWGEVGNLTLLLGTKQTGVANEYLFQFESGTTPTTLSLPAEIKWHNDEIPIIESGYIYQISILENLGSYLKFKK